MDIIFWVLIGILMLASLAGVVLPLIPDTIFLWGGFLLYQFTIATNALSLSFWIGMGIITILIVSSDFLTNIYFVKKYGGSKWAMTGALFGLLFGTFIFGPVGIIIGPFILVYIISLLEGKGNTVALKSSAATLIALFASSVFKIILQIVMIILFFINIM